MIRDLSDFKWLELIKKDLVGWDRNRRCSFHKDHDHITEQCKSLHFLVEKLIRVEDLKQYVCIVDRQRETMQELAVQDLASPATPRVVINYIHRGPVDNRYGSKHQR